MLVSFSLDTLLANMDCDQLQTLILKLVEDDTIPVSERRAVST
jgi:hypothetical protein